MSNLDGYCGGNPPGPGYYCDPFSNPPSWVSGRDAKYLKNRLKNKVDDFYNQGRSDWDSQLSTDTKRWQYVDGDAFDDDWSPHLTIDEIEEAIASIIINESRRNRYYESYLNRRSVDWHTVGTTGKVVFGLESTMKQHHSDSLKESSEKRSSTIENIANPGTKINNKNCDGKDLKTNMKDNCIINIEDGSIETKLPTGFINTDNFSTDKYVTVTLKDGSKRKMIIKRIPYSPEKGEQAMVDVQVKFANILSNHKIGPEIICAFNYEETENSRVQIIAFYESKERLTTYISNIIKDMKSADNDAEKEVAKDRVEYALDLTIKKISALVFSMGMSCYIFSPNFFMYDEGDIDSLRLYDIGTSYCITENLTQEDKILIFYICALQISVSLQKKVSNKKIVKDVMTKILKKIGIFRGENTNTGEVTERTGSNALNTFISSVQRLLKKFPSIASSYKLYDFSDIRSMATYAIHSTNPEFKNQGSEEKPSFDL